MTHLSSLLTGLLALAFIGGGIVIYRMDTRIAELEAKAVASRATRPSETRSARGLDQSTEEVVKTLEDGMTSLRGEVEAVRGTLPAMEAADGAMRGPVLSPSARVALDKHVAEVVDRKLEERLAKGEKENEGLLDQEESKPSVSELSKAVEMTPEQEDATVSVLNEGKRRSFEILNTPRADGGSMAGDLVAALKNTKDPKEAVGAWFQRILKEKIPGRSETYVAEIMKIKNATWEGLGGALDEKQMTKLKRMGLDILEVKTGYEPFEELFSGD